MVGREASAADESHMRVALDEARTAGAAGEIPVGAVVVANGAVLARAHNLREERQSALAHAEILAIGTASARLKSWRLEECTIYVTLEPCIMCVGAILQARIARLVFGCLDPKAGAVESLYRLCEDTRLNHRLPVTRGILAEDCGRILSDFFSDLRREKQREGFSVKP